MLNKQGVHIPKTYQNSLILHCFFSVYIGLRMLLQRQIQSMQNQKRIFVSHATNIRNYPTAIYLHTYYEYSYTHVRIFVWRETNIRHTILPLFSSPNQACISLANIHIKPNHDYNPFLAINIQLIINILYHNCARVQYLLQNV